MSLYYKWYLLVILVSVGIEWLQRVFVSDDNLMVLFLLGIASSVFVSAMHYGLYKLSKDGAVDMRYWRHFLRILPELLLAFLFFSVAGGIGFLMFIVPGFIIMTRFMFFPYIMLEYDVSIKEAFIHSNSITEGFRPAVMLVILLMIFAAVAEVPFLQGIYGEQEHTQGYTLTTGLLYGFSVLVMQPISIAVLLFGYSQMHSSTIGGVDRDDHEHTEQTQ